MKTGASSVVRRRIVLAIAALAFCGVGTLWLLDLIPDPTEIRDRLDGSGAAGPIVFLLAFIAIQPWGLPGALFIVPAALVWPPLVAFGLSWLGANLAGLLGFLFARWAGRDWARSRLSSFVATYVLASALGFIHRSPSCDGPRCDGPSCERMCDRKCDEPRLRLRPERSGLSRPRP